jgi:hypothetical protein
MRIDVAWLCVDQRAKSKKRTKRYKWPLDHRHSTAVLLIEHPLGNDELISAGKKQLNLVLRLTGKRNSPNDRHHLAELRMVWIVNRQGNMGSL